MKADIYKRYEVGSTTTGGDTIKEILFASKKFVIFLAQDGRFQCEYDEDSCTECDRSVSEAGSLYVRLKSIGLPKTSLEKGTTLIAAGLSRALESRTPNSKAEYFADAHAFVSTRFNHYAQSTYLLASFVVTLYLVLAIRFPALVAIGTAERAWSCAIGFGALGAFLSVLQRFRLLKVLPFTSPSSLVFDGVVRIALGATFGVVFLLLQRLNVLLGVAAGDENALALFSLIAGINERFVPTLLEHTASTVAASKPDV